MINKEATNINQTQAASEAEILPLLYSIINTKLDSMANMDHFLQLIADTGAKIVSARNSSLVIFTDKMDIPSSEAKARDEPAMMHNFCRSDSYIVIPLLLRGLKDPLGYLRVENKQGNQKFDSKDLFSLLLLSRQVTLKIENDLLYKRVHQDLIDSLLSMVNMLESRDKYTYSHSRRVSQFALAIAEELGLDQKEKDVLHMSGLLHDIGKIGLPDSILNKKDSLNKDELEMVKTHPLVGENIMRPLDFLALERSIIRHHHERLDGSGYPDGLEGDELSLCTRIMAVADSFDAITSARPYRKARSYADGLEELTRLADEKYDRYVVSSLKKALFRSDAYC
ncbi:MAG: HD domain-containing protein [bacterium]|nr:HD domain-containing protein [bacterium]